MAVTSKKRYQLALLTPICAIGLILSSFGVISAVLWSKATWYSYFTVGSLLLLAPISYALRRNNLQHTLLELTLQSPLLFVFLYLLFFALGSLIDLFYGTKICNLWYYPRYDAESRAIHNLIIGYPFAFLSVIPLYEISEFFWLSKKKDTDSKQPRLSRKSILFLLTPLSLVLVTLPVVSSYFGLGSRRSELCVLGAAGGLIFVDSLRALFQRDSFLMKISSGHYRSLIALLSAAWIAGFVHEVPNTFSKTWEYQNVPFTSINLFGVNVVVLFLGWFFLMLIAVSLFRIIDPPSLRKPELKCLQLEKPAKLLRVPYLVFWLMFAALLVIMRFVLLRAVDAHDPYWLLTLLMGIGIVWIASEIIWSYKALFKLSEVIDQIAAESKRAKVLNWYKNWLSFIYRSGTMALTGIFVAALFTPMIFVKKALCWTGSNVVCNFDSIYYLFTLFLGGMSQFPFYGMSLLALRLPRQPLENINLFLSTTGDVRKFGRLFALIGSGGLGLLLLAEIWLYVAPITAIWMYVQLIIAILSLGTLPWFLLTQYNIHKLMVRKKKAQLDKVYVELNRSIEAGFERPNEVQFHKILVLTSLKTQIEQLPEWPFNTSSLIQLLTLAGAVAGLVPLIEFVKK